MIYGAFILIRCYANFHLIIIWVGTSHILDDRKKRLKYTYNIMSNDKKSQNILDLVKVKIDETTGQKQRMNLLTIHGKNIKFSRNIEL